MKTSCSPSASAACRTACEPGTTRAVTRLATRCPFTTRAASRRSDSREFVHDPTKATSMGVPSMRAPGSKPMNSSASATPARSSSGTSRGPGTRPDTNTDCPGLSPHVTTGSSAAASTRTSSS